MKLVFLGQCADGGSKGVDLIPVNGKTGGKLVTAIAFQQRR